MRHTLTFVALMLAPMACLAAPHDPILLFRASFDKDIERADTARGEPEFVPQLKDRSPLWKQAGQANWQRSKDYKMYRVAQATDGRLGACLDVGRGKGQHFRALGNVSVRRGTFAFWVKFGRPLSTAHAPIFEVSGMGVTLQVRYKTVRGRVGASEFTIQDVQWEPNRWYHVALVYDCYQGVKVYVDGRLRSSHWGKPEHQWHTDITFADLMSLGCSPMHGAELPLAFDELVCYSEPLASGEIALLAAGKPLSPQPKTEPPPSWDVIRAHRLQELAWDVMGDMLAVKNVPLCVRKLGVLSSREVKLWRMGPVDGLPSTRWPGDYHGYEIPNRGLHLALEKGAQVDYLAIRGDFEGRLYRGLDINEPPKEQALLALKNTGSFLRVRPSKPLVSDELSFFSEPRSRTVDKLGRQRWSQSSSIRELEMFHVGATSSAIAQAKAVSYYLSAQPYEPKDKWVRWALQSHYEPPDRVTMRLSRQQENQSVRLSAMRHVHWFIPPEQSPVPMAGLRLHLLSRKLERPVRVRVQVRDPVDITRFMLDLDLRLESQTADVTLDLQDFIIPAGQPLWVRVTPEHELDLLPASRVDVLTRPLEEVQVEHVRNLLNYAKDRFIHVSEPRPWGHVPLRECGERLLAFRQLNLPLEDLHRNAPKNDKVFGLWAWTHPDENPPLDWAKPTMPPGAPQWAVFQKEAAKLYRAFALWWIENRQLPNGLFGSMYGDDTDLVNDWLSLGLLNDNDGRIRDSVRRLADYCWTQGPIHKGINRRHTDTLHAYEEGINTQPILAQLYYGNPVYLARLMETSRTVRDELTYVLPGNRRFFKAWWYGATHIDTEYERGRDILGNALLLHPTLYLGYYSRNPGAVELLKQWAGTWCDLQTKAMPKGPFPIAAQYPDGKIVETTPKWITGYGYQDLCLGMYVMTGDEKYATPMRTWVDFGNFSLRTAEDWIGLRNMSAYRDLIVASADAIDWTPLDPAMGDDSRTLSAYKAWQVTGKKSYVETALENAYKRIAVLFPMHTWAEQSADRVAVSKTLVDRLYLGGTPGYRNKLWPTHTVSWEGFSEEFAAWVLHTKPDALRVWIYNFEPKPQQGRLRIWGLDNGEYEVALGADPNQDESPDRALWKRVMPLARYSAIPLELPSRELVVLEIKQIRRGPPLFARPDLAVVNTDMSYDTKTGKLTFVVHNVGNIAATDVEVSIHAGGKVVAARRIPKLDAPLDLMPRTITFTETLPPGTTNGMVEVDPRNQILEITKENNRALF